jgi:hypothetical protein
MNKKYEYYDDLPPRNHPDYHKKWREKNREHTNKKWKVWYDSLTPEQKKEKYKWNYINNKKYYEKNKVRLREDKWKKNGIKNLTWQLFEETLKKQKGLCKICNIEMTKPHADHDHKTGNFRALLCTACNLGLGIYEKMTKEFNNYLKEFK